MQVTIDIPDQLARQLEPESAHLTEILENGLRLRNWIGASQLAAEVVEFLARGPNRDEILAFKPSERSLERAQTLLDHNSRGSLTPAERAELDEMSLLDQFVTLIKAKAFEQTPRSAA